MELLALYRVSELMWSGPILNCAFRRCQNSESFHFRPLSVLSVATFAAICGLISLCSSCHGLVAEMAAEIQQQTQHGVTHGFGARVCGSLDEAAVGAPRKDQGN